MNWKIKTKRNIFAVSAMLLLTLSCGSAGNKSKDAVISGNIEGGSGQEITLQLLLPTEMKSVDTTVIGEDGSFAFSNTKVENIGFYRIRQGDQNFITVILEPGEKLVLKSGWNLGSVPYTVSGSKESERLQRLNIQMTKLYMAQDSMNKVYQNNQNNVELVMQLQKEFDELTANNAVFAKSFIEEDPGSFANLAAAEQLNPEKDAELFRSMDKELGKKYAETEYYKEFHKIVVKMGQLTIGSEAPDIILPNPEGNMVKLSDFRGKVVLVDFWAAWCRPCRMENPNVVKAYNKYKSKGFEVFGVSLDQTKEKWLEAIEADGLHWTQVSDLMFWNSSVVKLYDIKGIPFAVLIDRDGKIIAKNLRGPALEEKLEEILN